MLILLIYPWIGYSQLGACYWPSLFLMQCVPPLWKEYAGSMASLVGPLERLRRLATHWRNFNLWLTQYKVQRVPYKLVPSTPLSQNWPLQIFLLMVVFHQARQMMIPINQTIALRMAYLVLQLVLQNPHPRHLVRALDQASVVPLQ